jgi:Putative mono-oxygenase ydhR
MRTALPSLLLAVALGSPARMATAAQSATDATDGGPVVVIVKVAKPWYAPNWLVERKMQAVVQQYRQLPGLTFKIFSFARPHGEFGGIYLWHDRATAQAWFGPAWYKRVRDERGVEPDVRMFDATRVFDRTSGVKLDTVENAVVTVITGAKTVANAGAPPVDPQAPGLLRAYLIDTPDGRTGGVYLWRDDAAAKRMLDSDWQRRQQALHGSTPKVEWFDTPILTRSTLPANRDAERGMLGATAGAALR